MNDHTPPDPALIELAKALARAAAARDVAEGKISGVSELTPASLLMSQSTVQMSKRK